MISTYKPQDRGHLFGISLGSQTLNHPNFRMLRDSGSIIHECLELIGLAAEYP